jgi:hypothetical protein
VFLGEKSKGWLEFVALVESTEEAVRGWGRKALDEELDEKGWKGQKAGKYKLIGNISSKVHFQSFISPPSLRLSHVHSPYIFVSP